LIDSLDPGDPKSILVRLMDALVDVNASAVFVDDLTLLLLELE
jgi:hypothetical protein